MDGPRKDSKPEIFKDRESKLSVDSMNVSPSSNRPKKPVRSKLSTVSSPPPIPPKPPSMADLPKVLAMCPGLYAKVATKLQLVVNNFVKLASLQIISRIFLREVSLLCYISLRTIVISLILLVLRITIH